MNTSSRPALGALLRRFRVPLLLLALVALAAFLYYRYRDYDFKWGLFIETFRRMNWWWFSAAAGLIYVSYFGRVLRWEILLRPVRSGASYWRLFKATAIGFTAVVLFGRPGEVVRPYLIAMNEGVPFSSQLAAWLLERIFDLLMILAMFGFALTRLRADAVNLGPGLTWALQAGGWVAGVIAVVCLTVLFLLGRHAEAMQRRLRAALEILPDRFAHKLDEVVEAFIQGASSARSQHFVFMLFTYTVLEWTIVVASVYCFFQGYPETARLGLTEILVFNGFIAFGSILQIPGIGGGMQVVAAVVLTQVFGLPIENATGLALLVWLLTFVSIVPVGIPLALHEGLTFRRIRDIEKKAGL